MAQLVELIGRMNPTSYWPTEPHLWLVGKMPSRTRENCRETSEKKAETQFYAELVNLLIQLAMERKNDFNMASTCVHICEGRPMLRRAPGGGPLNPTLTLGRAAVGS